MLAAAPDSPMPPAQQNSLVQKHCAVCHTDAVPSGCLSLEHFDATHVDPSLAAMLLSKLKNGAMSASGLAVPDKATFDGFVNVLTSQSAGSREWTVNEGPTPTASIARESSSTLYRLVLACNEMQLSWSPKPKTGTLSVSVDGKPPMTYRLEGDEKLNNGVEGTAFIKLQAALPVQALSITSHSPDETIVFPFAAFPAQARKALAACF